MGGRFEGKVVFITGGNSGIGLATAREFKGEGAKLAVTGRDEKTLAEVREELGPASLVMKADVSKIPEIELAVRQAGDKFGQIDVLFLNAGIGTFLPIESVTEEQFDELFAVNVKGAFFTMQKALPLLGEGALVILTGSVSAHIGTANSSVYAATKAAVVSFAANFASELVGRGIRVNAVSPGPVSTAIWRQSGLSPQGIEERIERIRQKVPMKRVADPKEIARVVLFLASGDSSFITGSEVIADGGMVQGRD